MARAAVRLGFHDAGAWSQSTGPGGADGSLLLNSDEIARSENNGLQDIRTYGLSLLTKYSHFGVGAADLVQFMHNIAVVVCPLGPRQLYAFLFAKAPQSTSLTPYPGLSLEETAALLSRLRDFSQTRNPLYLPCLTCLSTRPLELSILSPSLEHIPPLPSDSWTRLKLAFLSIPLMASGMLPSTPRLWALPLLRKNTISSFSEAENLTKLLVAHSDYQVTRLSPLTTGPATALLPSL